MAETSSVDVILDFLKKNHLTRAEAALRSELSNHPDLNGLLEKLALEDKNLRKVVEEENGAKSTNHTQGSGPRHSGGISKELIVKEIECGVDRNGPESKWKNSASDGEQGGKNTEAIDSEGSVLDLYSWNFNPSNGPSNPYKNDVGTSTSNFSGRANAKSGEEFFLTGEMKSSWLGSNSTSNANAESQLNKIEMKELKELDWQLKTTVAFSAGNPWSKNEEPTNSSSDLWKDCSVKTVFPFPKGEASTSYDTITNSDKRDGKKKANKSDLREAIKEQVDEAGKPLFFGKSQGSTEQKNLSGLGFSLASSIPKEEFPRLPPVKIKSEDKPSINWQEKFEHDGPSSKVIGADNSYLIGSYLDVPIGQEVNSSGGKRIAGGSWLSVSQGIAEDTSDLVSGFATIGDGLSESIDFQNEYWDSDEYDDDDDVGYMRQPIEDEAWFLAHEIDYPSDNEKGAGHGSVPDPQDRDPTNDEDDDQSFAEEDSNFSGEQIFQAKTVESVTASDDPIGLSVTKMYGMNNGSELIAHYDGQLMDEEELSLMRAEPVWKGFVTQTNELIMIDGKDLNECGRPQLDDICMDDDQHGSVRSIGVGINSDAADIGSEIRESLVGGSSEGDVEYFCDHDTGVGGSRSSHHVSDRKYVDKQNRDKKKLNKYVVGSDQDMHAQGRSHADGPDDMIGTLRRKSCDSSTFKSSRDENNTNAVRSVDSSPSSLSNYGYTEPEHAMKERDGKIGAAKEEDPGASLEDEEAAAVQEQVRQIKVQEEEFETFNLKIVHRKNRTGFEEDKNFHVVLNSVIAGRYHVTEYLGSAAFSKAIQAHDLHTGMDVCVKIIKNNKDFFDQSLDEIKLLKYINKHDHADKYHILRLYDYFYYREHLLIVCELLKANLYEFHKFNRESGGEVYFTMPRLQSITTQCLEALQFLHGLGLIHCDLKPENILVKSYSRCEVKVIDLGSSCFETDHLCSYVQSRSYRAPEVILGHPYDKKIDVWSLGCILAELCTGNVLFQNDSPATLLARVIGIIGPIDQSMLAKGRDTYKYFTKNHMLYERNQDTSRLEYLIPKKTSLRHRLPMGDQGFVDFVSHLLEVNPKKRPAASEALKHPWLSHPYEPISA
uniref:Protein kinase domain-containing protein n=1 Tax=Salix viminalis TaxID=40686 RepID=A0A6N2LY82_SALVM